MSTLFQVSKKCSAIWRCEPFPNGNWPKHFSFYFQPLSRTFSVPKVSVPKYFGDLFSLWKVQQAGIIPRPMAHEYPALCTRPLQHKKWCIITENNENFRYICRTDPKMKNFCLFTELFRWAKRCAGKIPEYGGKNKSGLLAEKKPAYGRKKNYGQ